MSFLRPNAALMNIGLLLLAHILIYSSIIVVGSLYCSAGLGINLQCRYGTNMMNLAIPGFITAAALVLIVRLFSKELSWLIATFTSFILMSIFAFLM